MWSVDEAAVLQAALRLMHYCIKGIVSPSFAHAVVCLVFCAVVRMRALHTAPQLRSLSFRG